MYFFENKKMCKDVNKYSRRKRKSLCKKYSDGSIFENGREQSKCKDQSDSSLCFPEKLKYRCQIYNHQNIWKILLDVK